MWVLGEMQEVVGVRRGDVSVGMVGVGGCGFVVFVVLGVCGVVWVVSLFS